MKNKLLYFGNCSAFEKTKLSNPSLGVGGAGTQQGAPLKLWFPPPSTPPPAALAALGPFAPCGTSPSSCCLGWGCHSYPGRGSPAELSAVFFFLLKRRCF